MPADKSLNGSAGNAGAGRVKLSTLKVTGLYDGGTERSEVAPE